MNKKWFDFKDAAKQIGLTAQDFYAVVRNNEFELRNDITFIPNKRMISIKGIRKLIKIK